MDHDEAESALRARQQEHRESQAIQQQHQEQQQLQGQMQQSHEATATVEDLKRRTKARQEAADRMAESEHKEP